MPNTREKLIELLNEIQDSGIIETPAGFGFTKQYIENERIATHLITNGVTVQKWIPVTERLPEEDGDYLTCCNYGEWLQISILCFSKDGDNIWGGGFSGEKNVFYYDYDGVNVSQEYVTHWMPLPEPPKGE